MEPINCTNPCSTNKVITFTSHKKSNQKKGDGTQNHRSRSVVIDSVMNSVEPDHNNHQDKDECHTTYHRHLHSHSHSHSHTLSPEYEVYFTHPKQVQMINLLYLTYEGILIEKASGLLHKESDRILYSLLEDVKSKINGYKRQDLKKFCNDNHSHSHKKRYSEEYISTNIVTPHDTIELLVSNRLKCVYCKDPCLLIYKTRYDKKQWTLDRIDNDMGHTISNVVVCCLECNIKRGTMNKERFEKGKQIRYIRKLQF